MDNKPLTSEEVRNHIRQRLREDDRCVQCGALFLYGIDDARLSAKEAACFGGFNLKAGDPYCFFCWNEINVDHTDPETWPHYARA